MSTTFHVLRDDETIEDWPDSTHVRETLIIGELADRIRAKSGMVGDVVMVEDGTEGGYSEWTSEWDFDVTVKVGESVAWSTDYGSGVADVTETGYGTMGELMRWLGTDG